MSTVKTDRERKREGERGAPNEGPSGLVIAKMSINVYNFERYP